MPRTKLVDMSAEQHDDDSNLPGVRQAHEYVKSAFEIMAAGAPAMAESLVNLGSKAKSEMVRMMAATAVMDRIGLPGKVDVGITAVHLHGGEVEQREDPAVVVAKRLKLLQQYHEQSNVIEGEVLPFPVPDEEEE